MTLTLPKKHDHDGRCREEFIKELLEQRAGVFDPIRRDTITPYLWLETSR